MSAIDTYKKCSLHSAAPYIGRNVRVCKKAGGNVREGETSKGENVRRKTSRGNVLHPTHVDIGLT